MLCSLGSHSILPCSLAHYVLNLTIDSGFLYLLTDAMPTCLGSQEGHNAETHLLESGLQKHLGNGIKWGFWSCTQAAEGARLESE